MAKTRSRLTREGLTELRERLQIDKQLREEGVTARVTVHLGTCGLASGAGPVWDACCEIISQLGRQDIHITSSGCIGLCSQEPLVTVETLDAEPILYSRVDPVLVQAIIREHVLGGRIIAERALLRGFCTGELPRPTRSPLDGIVLHVSEFPFFARQRSLVLRNRGRIDPDSIEDYIWRDGYRGLERALFVLSPDRVAEEVRASGLRGRGGGGFPTGLKWTFCAKASGRERFVLCNADEGDPGAFMDRSLMEADPHAVLEGMIIAARAIGAHQGYIYCRAEYPLAVKRLTHALSEARARGLLGRNILGSGFGLDIEVYQGAGAFVCGEETALMASIEGRRGTPRPRPPFPAVSGLWHRPTVLNNVETYANVPVILREGAEAYASIGTEASKGTKVFALTGQVRNVGLVEVDMGTPLGDIIYDIGGGIPEGRTFKAVQLGGPSGGCIPAHHLNTPTDYEAIQRVGAIMGSGGMIVMDANTCMVDMARYFMDFCQDESCGKCTPCRVGTRRMLQILERICQGEGGVEDITLLLDLATSIRDASLCGLGQTAPNPVLSTIQYFLNEYLSHIEEHHCQAAVCSALFKSPCQHTCPVGMDIPAYVSLVRAGRPEDAYRILLRTNPLPASSGRVCPHPCQLHCRRGQLDGPVAIRSLKRHITDVVARPRPVPLVPQRAESVGIVGAGPSGLAAAWELRRRGYRVTVYEKQARPGGMLRYGIPAYRLPRDVLDAEIEAILATGVDLQTGVSIGSGVSLDALKLRHDAVYLAMGAQRSVRLGIPGEAVDGVWEGLTFLRTLGEERTLAVGERVAVIGGGNAAIDAARSALRVGGREVTVYYRRRCVDMPAYEEEILAAMEEGVVIRELVLPVEILVDSGRVSALRVQRQALDTFDASGRRQPVPMSGEGETVAVDTVIVAVGQRLGQEVDAIDSALRSPRHTIGVDRHGRTVDAQVWAGGDAARGPATVIEAVRDGLRAAASMDGVLREHAGSPPWVEPPQEPIQIPVDVPEEPDPRSSHPLVQLRVDLRKHDFREVETGYNATVAVAEACRCLRCDVCVE